jgi:thiopurine S-methyltransferase
MEPQELTADYWTGRWQTGETQWDIGYPSTPLKTYIDQLEDRSLRILVPGAGNAYEGIYLLEKGFSNTVIIDISPEPVAQVRKTYPSITDRQLILGDFFELEGTFDLILEQTFFCALHPSQRSLYVEKCYELLADGGRLAGVLFDAPLNKDFPPYGGTTQEYIPLFQARFEGTLEKCYNSIKPREGRELFMHFVKK